MKIIVAVSENGTIGNENKLLWKLKSDLKKFKELTTGKTIVMGRKTFDSLGKMLPNRNHVVITRNPDAFNEKYKDNPYIEFTNDINYAKNGGKFIDVEVWIIGGSEIYYTLISECKELYLTKVHTEIDGDAKFPIEYVSEHFELSSSEFNTKDEDNEFDYSFEVYIKK